jgi:hypothetical protein
VELDARRDANKPEQIERRRGYRSETQQLNGLAGRVSPAPGDRTSAMLAAALRPLTIRKAIEMQLVLPSGADSSLSTTAVTAPVRVRAASSR